MGTPYTDIFDAYLNKVKDDLYVNMDAQELNIELIQILNSALPRFLYPKIDLTDRTSTEFVNVLTNEEIQIIATLMNLVWAENQLSDIEVTRQVFRDHDFQLTSQASHLRALMGLKSDLKASCRDLMQAYYKVEGRKPNFAGLAGGFDNA